MRRLGSTFTTLWVLLFIPSLVVWGVMVRWSEGAANCFEVIWRWSADRLAFPLLLDAQIEWSWRALEAGSRSQAIMGFVFLTSLWAVMFALPLSVIGAWWVWLASRGQPPSSVSSARTDYAALVDPDLTVPALATTTTRPPPSPTGALHLLTIPLALVYYGARATLVALRPALVTFALCWAGAMFVFGVWIHQIDAIDWRTAVMQMRVSGWEGYLDALHVPRILNSQWYAWWQAVWAQELVDRGAWDRTMELRYLIALYAARHALIPAVVVGVGAFLRSLVRHGKELV